MHSLKTEQDIKILINKMHTNAKDYSVPDWLKTLGIDVAVMGAPVLTDVPSWTPSADTTGDAKVHVRGNANTVEYLKLEKFNHVSCGRRFL